jgi:hypothetical protein
VTDFSPSVPLPVSSAPAGWYPDPHLPGQLRWFDGAGWTGHVHAAPPFTAAPTLSVGPWGSGPPAWPAERDRAMEAILPVNRSGLAIAAGYAGLFSILLVFAPIALVLGVLALRDLSSKPTVAGRGRAWFGIVAGALGTVGLVAVMLP